MDASHATNSSCLYVSTLVFYTSAVLCCAVLCWAFRQVLGGGLCCSRHLLCRQRLHQCPPGAPAGGVFHDGRGPGPGGLVDGQERPAGEVQQVL
jgi:hypothetical protein